MLKVTGSGAMLGVLNLLPTTVFAAAGDGDAVKEETAPLLRDELSLYTAAPRQESRYVEPEAGQLEESVATLRKLLEPYTDWCRGTYNHIKPKVQRAVRFGNDTYSYLKDPPKDFYPRAGVIGFTGILGLFLARGSRIKRLLYPAGLVTVSASLYYPEQAAAIAKSTGDSVYDRAVRSYAAVEKMVKPQSKAEKSPDSDTKP
ncbi:MICOS complex subunit MIC26-like [Dicentrarchus labrax]|uniref:MICOS complex subunit MIC26-like n=1 Tax=Dicentrarchus labrax TaxID=13489 RepID=UPI0021F635A6|nr:MICOS complex subunit MIC26-like [Dicentrarchus labrax]